MVKNKFLSSEEAVKLIRNDTVIATSGFRWSGSPELLLKELGRRYRETKVPNKLTIVFSSAQGDSVSNGLEHLAQKGMLKRVVGGFWGITPQLLKLCLDGEFEGFNLPQGQIAQLYRSIASKSPGQITKVGLGTFIDPRVEGCQLNENTANDLVEVVSILGEEYLLYRSFKIDYGFIRGTFADQEGNISVDHEAVHMETLSLAMAVHNSGGKVIAQVKDVVKSGNIPAKSVSVPGYLVDFIVEASDYENDHRQCVETMYEPSYSGEEKKLVENARVTNSLIRRIIAKRAILELKNDDIINLGQGIPTDIVPMLNQNSSLSKVQFTLESGVSGGVPRTVPDFGISSNPESIIRQDEMFTFYNGGGLDVAFLGFAEVDVQGNVNVSKFGNKFVGCGGFIDITQNTSKLVFCGSFSAKGLVVSKSNGCITVENEGSLRKFVDFVKQITFSGNLASQNKQEVLYITERAVFRLKNGEMELTEIAPGIDLENDILKHMGFVPNISPVLTSMDVSE